MNYRKCSLLNLKWTCKKPVSAIRDKNGSSVLMRRLLPTKSEDRRSSRGRMYFTNSIYNTFARVNQKWLRYVVITAMSPFPSKTLATATGCKGHRKSKIQGGSDKSGIFFFSLSNDTAQLKIIRFDWSKSKFAEVHIENHFIY